MYFGKAIKFGGYCTGGVELFVFLGGKASCLFNVFKKGNEFVLSWEVGSLGSTLYVLVSFISQWPDEAASVWMPAKACQWFYNDFTLFLAVPVLSNMYTDKDSNLISDLRTKYGEDSVRTFRKWEIITISQWSDEAASVWMPAKACQWFYNAFTLFSAVPVLSNMYTDKDSNLISEVFWFILFQWFIHNC